MKIKTLSNKLIEVDEILTEKTFSADEIKKETKKLFDKLQSAKKSDHYNVVKVIRNNKECFVWVDDDELKRVKKILREKSKRAYYEFMRERARLINSADERTFRKGLEFDWRY